MNKTILLGLNDPKSDDPSEALSARPGSAGERLWRFLNEFHGVTRGEYEAAFDRRNVLGQRTWDLRKARELREELLQSLDGRRVILLGSSVCRTLALEYRPWFQWRGWGVHLGSLGAGGDFCVIPHPSGLSRPYNDPPVRASAAMILREEMRRGQRIQGGGSPGEGDPHRYRAESQQ